MTPAPLRNLVLARLRPMAEKTGLIHRVDTRWEYSRIADVLAVGPEVYDVKAGDVVVVPALVGQKVGSDDDRLIPESSILYAVEDAA